jgi:hypothetical protein
MIPVTASGTIRHGRGVYFKWRPSRSGTLEGSKSFTVTFRVPTSWRGAHAKLACTALGIDRGVVRPLDERIVCGARRFVLALYLDGDTEAKSAAQRLVRAETDFWKIVSASRNEIERRSRPTLVHRFGVLFDVVRPVIPEDWTQQLIYGPQAEALQNIAKRLPPEVRQAAAEYDLARRELRGLGTGTETQVQ